MTKTPVAPESLRVRTRAAVDRLGGDRPLAGATGIGRGTIVRVLAALPVRRGTCALLEQELDRLERGAL